MKTKTHFEFETEMKKAKPNIQLDSKYVNARTKILYHCNLDGYSNSSLPNSLLHNEYSCEICKNRPLIYVEDLWTTHKELAKLLANPEDGYRYSHGSNRKVDWICPICGELIHDRVINNICKQGLKCPKCSDGISYPNKFIYSVLNQLNINYKAEKVFDDIKSKKYDVYIPLYNMVIEMNGIQHYEECDLTTRTLEEEQENDRLKEELANGIGITYYIKIDARISELEFIKNSILNSMLVDLFDLSNIDWTSCDKNANNSLLISACNLWNDGNHDVREISKMLGLCRNTIVSYLKKGKTYNLCDYDAKTQMRLNGKINGSKSCNNTRKVKCLTTNESFNSILEANRAYGIGSGSISNHLRGKAKSAGKSKITGEKLVWAYF